MNEKQYRGRIAPSPTGYLHSGHAMTFWCAQERAHSAEGVLLLRIEDLDRARWPAHFTTAAMEDLRWFGLRWSEGPDVGGVFAPYLQGERFDRYASAWERPREGGFLSPCTCSRKDVGQADTAPHDEREEPIYPGTCRPRLEASRFKSGDAPGRGMTWRFRVPDGERVSYLDQVAAGKKPWPVNRSEILWCGDETTCRRIN